MVSLEVFWIASDAVHLVEYELIHVYALLRTGLRAHDLLHRQPCPALLPGCSLLELLHGIALPIVRDIDPWAGRTEAKEPRHQRRAKQHRQQRHPMPAQLCADRSRRGLCRRGCFRLSAGPACGGAGSVAACSSLVSVCVQKLTPSCSDSFSSISASGMARPTSQWEMVCRDTFTALASVSWVMPARFRASWICSPMFAMPHASFVLVFSRPL